MKTDNPFSDFVRRLACICALPVLLFFALPIFAGTLSPEEFSALQRRVKQKGCDPAEMRKLADCLLAGNGTEKDPDRAMAWYGNAADYGDAEALEKLREFSRARIKIRLPKPLLPPGTKFPEEQVRRETIKLLNYLIASQAELRSRHSDPYKLCPRFRASLPAVSKFLRNGAAPQLRIPAEELEKSSNSYDAFTFAMETYDFELMKLLVANGADCNFYWRRMIERAIRNLNSAYRSVTYSKKKKEEKFNSPEEIKAERVAKKRKQRDYLDHCKLLETMLQLGGNPRLRDGSGMTLMGKAWSPPAIKLMIKYGGDINQTNNPDDNCSGDPGWGDFSRSTPIFDAISYNDYYGVKALIEAGADLHFVNADGKTPLDAAVENARTRSGPFGEIANEILKMIKAAAEKSKIRQ